MPMEGDVIGGSPPSGDAALRWAPRRFAGSPSAGYFCQEGFCVGLDGPCAGAAGFDVTGVDLGGVVDAGLPGVVGFAG